jgi:hypothetical protein
VTAHVESKEEASLTALAGGGPVDGPGSADGSFGSVEPASQESRKCGLIESDAAEIEGFHSCIA